MTTLLIGARGQVGYELRRALSPLGPLLCTVRSEPGPEERLLDIEDDAALRDCVRDIQPEVIVNAAAYTAVDAAESEPEAADRSNHRAVAALAALAAEYGSLLVHYSTDYVFDGPRGPSGADAAEAAGRRAYSESDACDPQGAYARSKYAGEQAVLGLEGATAHLVFRTGWVYGARGRNFALTMMRLAAGADPIRVVADQYGTPTWSRLIAEATGYAVAQMRRAPEALRRRHSGLYHLCAPDHTTWYGFARHVIERCAGPARAAEVTPITTAEYPVPAPRPAWSVMDPGKLRRVFSLSLPPWRTQFDWMYEERAALRAAAV